MRHVLSGEQTVEHHFWGRVKKVCLSNLFFELIQQQQIIRLKRKSPKTSASGLRPKKTEAFLTQGRMEMLQ